MLVLGLVDTSNMKWCQITTGWGKYTCPTKVIDGKVFFRFKRVWHPVAEYISEHADVLFEENGRLFSKPFNEYTFL